MDKNDICTCGHSRIQHIDGSKQCSGLMSHCDCQEFTLTGSVPTSTHFQLIPDEEIEKFVINIDYPQMDGLAYETVKFKVVFQDTIKALLQAQLTACERVIAAYQDKGLEEGISQIISKHQTDIQYANAQGQASDTAAKEIVTFFTAHRMIDNGKVADILKDLVDSDDCRIDHHGYCQAHGWLQSGVCPHFRAKALLAKYQER